ncbi:MAG: hypothetical protein JJE36_02230 [Coriobacteriia bacterium]|nr:hypothetical protein [Coriobacteriia bacterium]
MAVKNNQKINLLPQAILDQRRFELWYPWIAIIGLICLLLIGLFFIGFAINLSSRTDELNATKSETTDTKAQAAKLKKYEDAKKTFTARETIVNQALAQRMDPYLCGLAVTKYLPSTVSIENMSFDALMGMSLNGVVEDTGGNPTDKDWKGVANAMDSLGEAPIVHNLWLSKGAMTDAYNNYEGSDSLYSAAIQDNFPDVVDQFSITGDLKLTIDTGGDTHLWTDKAATATGGATR